MSIAVAPSSPRTWGRPPRPVLRRRRRTPPGVRYDEVAAHLAELHLIRDLLARATTVVADGWIQNAWVSLADAVGVTHLTASHDLARVSAGSVQGACLVGGIVVAGGGPATAHTQLVQRTLDLTWHALRHDPDRPVRWCPAPSVRLTHVRDLTGWNDAAGRVREEVLGLLARAGRTADREIERTRSKLAALPVGMP